MSEEDNGCVIPIPTGNINAMAWAEAFAEYKRVYEWSLDDIDAELMVGWFANYWATVNDPLQAKVEGLTAALTKIRDHKSPHLGLRDNARRYIAEQALKQEGE